jgi:hypothetical protein
MRKESMQTTGVTPYEAPESTVFHVSEERSILSGGGTIEDPGEEPL